MNLKKNIIYQIVYQIIVLVIPLALSKYVTNVITKDTLGVYSYSYSIASYCYLFAMLGIQKYGTRAISQVKDDKIKLRKTFWSLYTVHSITSLMSIVAYFAFCFFYPVESKIIYYIQGLYVVSATVDITWLFYGLENFRSVVIKNLAIKIIEIIFIFTFVKSDSDLGIYTFIKSSSIFAGQIVLFPSVLKNIPIIRINRFDVKTHIKPLIILSISVFSTSVYAMLDKVLLGALSPSGSGDVALYEYADKIVRIPLSIIAAVETVMLPRLSYISATGDARRFQNTIEKSVVFVGLVSVGAAFGIASISKTFVALWYGKDYQYCANLIMYLSPVVFIISFGDIIRSQFLIPKSRDKEYTISIFIGAFINLIINIILIPIYGIDGAIIGTIVAETAICLSQMWLTRAELPILSFCIENIPFICIGLVMFTIVHKIPNVLGISYISLLIQIMVGVFVYGLLSFIYLCLFKKDLIWSYVKV